MKHKSEVPEHLKACVASMRNIIGSNNKVCYLRTDQGTEFVYKETIKVLKEINGNETAGAELQLACPDTPEHNGVAERFNQTLETKVRSMMYDSGLPSSMWNLAIKTAVYVYNRTPHKSIDMKIPLTVLAPNFRLDLNQLKRFEYVSMFKILRNTNYKFGEQALRDFMVGNKPTGFIIYVSEEKKLYESRHVKFLENNVYRKIKTGGTELANKLEFSSTKKNNKYNEKEVHYTMPRSEGVFESDSESESEVRDGDVAYRALLAKIHGDPRTNQEAINSAEGENWKWAVESELNSLENKGVFEVVKRESLLMAKAKSNILDSRWIFKRKIDEAGNVQYKARLVIRGFKDKNNYELRETYAPVSRLLLVRSFLAIANKNKLHLKQLDVETAFLYGEIDIYIWVTSCQLFRSKF